MNLKEMRESRGLTQAELAKLSDVNVRTIQAYEQGLKDINQGAVITIWRLARVLHCRIEDLMEKTV